MGPDDPSVTLGGLGKGGYLLNQQGPLCNNAVPTASAGNPGHLVPWSQWGAKKTCALPPLTSQPSSSPLVEPGLHVFASAVPSVWNSLSPSPPPLSAPFNARLQQHCKKSFTSRSLQAPSAGAGGVPFPAACPAALPLPLQQRLPLGCLFKMQSSGNTV